MSMVDYVKIRNVLTEGLAGMKSQIDKAVQILSGGGQKSGA